MSGLLPATITKWFSHPSPSNTNGSAQVADATDSSTEDEAPESTTPTQPPSKRMRYTSPGNFNQPAAVETKCTSTNTESINELYTGHSQIGKSELQNNLMSTPIQSLNDDQTLNSDHSFFKPQHSLSPIDNSMTKKRKSLFGSPQDESIKKHGHSTTSNVRDPYFKPSLLSSPFYVGRTMYGGAASSYVNSPSIKRRKISVTSETNNDESVTISHFARRVMDLLEHYSSPLSEARRIPQIPNRSRNDSTQQSVVPYSTKPYSHKRQELYVPSVASILTIKRKSRLMDTTNAARQIIASHSSSSPEFAAYPKAMSDCNPKGEVLGEKFTTKVKSRLTRINRERNVEMEQDYPDSVNLPNVALQIGKDNLQKFSFGFTSNTLPSQSSSIQTPVIITPEALKRSSEFEKSDSAVLKEVEKQKTVQVDNNDSYKFSRPVQISSESNKNSSSQPKFSFGSPERNIEKVGEATKNDHQLPAQISSQIVTNNKLIPSQKSSDWRCLDCWVMNKTDVSKCVCCGGKKPVEIGEEIKKCSICNASIAQPQCDKCTECEKINNINKTFPVKEKTTDWNSLYNNESAKKDEGCGENNPKNVLTTDINSIHKLANKESTTFEDKGADIDNKFKEITNSQSSKWECYLCLVRNDSARDTCVCCEASKPGAVKESVTKFNFHQPSEIAFKFGIQPECQVTDIEPEESNMGEESETNNNILPKTSTFNFSVPTKKVEDVSESLMSKPTEAPKINFTFGIQKVDPDPPVRNSIFVMPNKLTEPGNNLEEKEKLQEVPQMFTSSKSDEQLKKNVGLFNTAVTSQVAPDIPALVPLSQTSSVDKKDLNFSTTSAITLTNSDAKTQSNFTFSTIMPASNLFVPVTSATTTSTSVLPAPLSISVPATATMPLFQKPNVVTTTTSASFFQKSDSLPNLSSSLFPKTEATTTSATLSTMSPVFSFGGGPVTVQQPTEKPKFNFNFSSNKTESTSVFKPAFGVATDNNGSSSTFNLPSNSTIGGNALPGTNPLNNITQVNVPNALTTGSTVSTPAATSIFGSTVPKENNNMWSSSTNNNIFAPNTTSDPVQKPPSTFKFGNTSFTASNAGFANATQQAQPTPPAPAVFGIPNPTNTSQPTMFGNPIQNQAAPNIFGAPQVPNNPMPMGIFGTPNAAATPSFGITNQPVAPFEAASAQPTPAPAAFNFGGQPSTGIFGFGQQPQPQAPAPQQPEAAPPGAATQPGMYAFGAPVMAGPQMQFTIGSAPNANTTVRRVRKAIRRTQR